MKQITVIVLALFLSSRLVAQGLPPAATKTDVLELNDHITRLQTMIDKLSKQVVVLTKQVSVLKAGSGVVPGRSLLGKPGTLTFKTRPTATQAAMTVSIDSVQYQINGGSWQLVTP